MHRIALWGHEQCRRGWWDHEEEFGDILLANEVILSTAVQTPCELWLLRALVSEASRAAARVEASDGLLDLSAAATDDSMSCRVFAMISNASNGWLTVDDVAAEMRRAFQMSGSRCYCFGKSVAHGAMQNTLGMSGDRHHVLSLSRLSAGIS